MSKCPRCNSKEKIKLIAEYYTNFDLEIQMICGKCGNIFRETIYFDDNLEI